MRAMFREIGILVKEDLSDGIDNDCLLYTSDAADDQ